MRLGNVFQWQPGHSMGYMDVSFDQVLEGKGNVSSDRPDLSLTNSLRTDIISVKYQTDRCNIGWDKRPSIVTFPFDGGCLVAKYSISKELSGETGVGGCGGCIVGMC